MAGIWNNRDGEVLVARDLARLPSDPTTPLHYCYQLQAWIEGDQVALCEHPEIQSGCYSCTHSGEVHDPADCADCR